MNNRPKLIMLGGFAGCGKTTIANRYLAEHPLALVIEGDTIITKLGQWKENISEAIACRTELMSALVGTHLKRGYDVMLPYLLRDAQDAERFEKLASTYDAEFYEITLEVEKEEAIQRLFKRGTWGEEGLPPLTPEDRLKAEKLYSDMVEAVRFRPNMISVTSKENDIDGTYAECMKVLSS